MSSAEYNYEHFLILVYDGPHGVPRYSPFVRHLQPEERSLFIFNETLPQIPAERGNHTNDQE